MIAPVIWQMPSDKVLLLLEADDFTNDLKNALTGLGFHVESAKNVMQAMEIMALHRSSIRAVVAELTGSNRPALDFASAISTLGFRPSLFFLSSDRSIQQQEVQKYGAKLLYPPFSAVSLAAAIQAAPNSRATPTLKKNRK